MKESFLEAFEFTIKEEGYSETNIMEDKGGDTIMGISSKFWPKEFTEIKAISNLAGRIEYAKNFYYIHFWNFINADLLPYPLDIIAFDSAVNPGEYWAKHTLRITQDCNKFLDMRENYYKSIKNPKFINGWTNRVNLLRTKYLST
jgi:lysozyme family protein